MMYPTTDIPLDMTKPRAGINSGTLDARSVLIAYLRMKIDAEDWHAVADAAMDLRELDAKASIPPPQP